MSKNHRADEPARTEELRADIANTRDDLGETVQALAAKTDVKERVSTRVRDEVHRASDEVHRVSDEVRRRPGTWGAVLAGLVAAAAAIWMLSRRRGRS
jgi:Protein of unknown function (DUF3618)